MSVEDHYQLNAGLRAYLEADAKHPDNSVLRLPDTTNWKTRQGRLVRIVGGNGKARSVSTLMKLSSFANAPKYTADADPGDWSTVDLNGTPRKYVRMARMSTEEAVGRYGNRHKAVWAVTKDLVKGGLTADQIHTLMHTFPAAAAKRDDEHGAYDVHKDVARCIKSASPVSPDDSGEAFEELSDEEAAAMDLEETVTRLVTRKRAERKANQILASETWAPPPDEVSGPLADALAHPPIPVAYLLDGICQVKHNVLLAGEYKKGKTTLVCNLMKSLVDHKPFLGSIDVTARKVVGFWSLEMEHDEVVDQYFRPLQVSKAEDLHIYYGVGYGVSILTETGRQWTISWLRGRSIQVWVIDSLARLARMAGVNENDNGEMMELLMAIDEIKQATGVEVTVLIAHTGRTQQEEGRERVRGATAIDDWAGARWVFTADGPTRFLAVDGRKVRMENTSLLHNEETNEVTLGIMGSRTEHRNGLGVMLVHEVVSKSPGNTQAALVKLIREVLPEGGKAQTTVIRHMIAEAVETGFIRVEPGPNNSKRYHPVKEGHKPEGGATVRPVHMGDRRR